MADVHLKIVLIIETRKIRLSFAVLQVRLLLLLVTVSNFFVNLHKEATVSPGEHSFLFELVTIVMKPHKTSKYISLIEFCYGKIDVQNLGAK